MLALLYALFVVGGRAKYSELQILLEHENTKSVRALVARAARCGYVVRPGASEHNGFVALSRNGAASMAAKVNDPVILARIKEARELRQRAANGAPTK